MALIASQLGCPGWWRMTPAAIVNYLCGVGHFNLSSTSWSLRIHRPELAKALEQARQGDVLVVWRLDRLARSLRHLIDIADDLNRRGVALKSITEAIDTTFSGGQTTHSQRLPDGTHRFGFRNVRFPTKPVAKDRQ